MTTPPKTPDPNAWKPPPGTVTPEMEKELQPRLDHTTGLWKPESEPLTPDESA